MLNGTKVVKFQRSVSVACFDLVWSSAMQLSKGNLELTRTRRMPDPVRGAIEAVMANK